MEEAAANLSLFDLETDLEAIALDLSKFTTKPEAYSNSLRIDMINRIWET